MATRNEVEDAEESKERMQPIQPRCFLNTKNIFIKASHEKQLHFRLPTRTQQKEEHVWKHYHEVLRSSKEVSPEMMERKRIRFVLKGLQPKMLEEVNLMDNGTLEKLRINVRKVEATSFLLGQSIRESRPSTFSEKDEIWELRKQMNQSRKFPMDDLLAIKMSIPLILDLLILAVVGLKCVIPGSDASSPGHIKKSETCRTSNDTFEKMGLIFKPSQIWGHTSIPFSFLVIDFPESFLRFS
ncbi:hypothetical protein Trydic_g842 [Trypoxylus dichotomus]